MPGNPHPRIEFLEPTKWKKGQSGNPKGKPKGAKTLTSTLKELLEREINVKNHPITGEQNVRLTVREMVMLSLLKKASQGDVKAIETILERSDGKVPLPMEHTGISVQLATIIGYIKEPTKLLEDIDNSVKPDDGSQE